MATRQFKGQFFESTGFFKDDLRYIMSVSVPRRGRYIVCQACFFCLNLLRFSDTKELKIEMRICRWYIYI